MSLMRNSRLPDRWVEEAVRANPFQRIIDSATGNPTGSLTTCPCRLSYPSLFAPEKNRQTGQPTKYKATLLFPPGVDLGVLVGEYHAAVQRLFPGIPANQDGSYPGLHPPFKDQGAKGGPGYTPGAWAITVSTQYKPHICDPALNPISDESRVYPGVWAIVAVNFYKFGVSPPQPKKGVGIGMQTVMIIADDESIGSAVLDPAKAFAKIQIQANFNAAAAFGAPGVAPTAPPPAAPGGFAVPHGSIPPVGGQQPGFPIHAMPWEEDVSADSLR